MFQYQLLLYIHYKVKADKIDEFLAFKNKSVDQLTSHEIRINQLISESSSMRTKYDKMFIDNFTVPGFVGEFCKFKTIRDFIEYSIKEMSNLNLFKDQMVVDAKNNNTKLENLIKQFTGSLDNFTDRQKETLSNAKKDIYNRLKEEIGNLDEKFEEVKIYNTNEAKILAEKTEDLIKVTRETTDFRDRLKNYFEQNLDEITSDFDEIRLNLSDLNDEYSGIKDKFKEIIDFVKDFNQKKYTSKKDDTSKKIITFQRQKTVNMRNKKVDFNEINNDFSEKKKSTKSLRVVNNDLEKEVPERKKKVEINDNPIFHENIEENTEPKEKEKEEIQIEKEKEIGNEPEKEPEKEIKIEPQTIKIKKEKDLEKEIKKEPQELKKENDLEIEIKKNHNQLK